MRVVIVNRFFYPDHSATSQLATDLGIYLAARGFGVTAVTSDQRYDSPTARLASRQQYLGMHIQRVRATKFGRRNLIGRALDYVSFYLAAFLAVCRVAGRGTVVIAMTDPPLLSVPTLLAAQFKGAHFINWMQDVFPEVAERLRLLRPRALAKPLRALRNWSLRHAGGTVVIGEQMAAALAPDCRVPPLVIPNWALEEPLESDDPPSPGAGASGDALRRGWGLDGDFVVGYSGNMGRAHRLDELLEAAQALSAHRGMRFLFVGDGAQRPTLEARAKAQGLGNVMFQPYQARERLRDSLSLPDIHVVSLDEKLEGLIVPSKFVGILAVGRPVLWIGASGGEVGALIRESGCGVVVAPGDIATLCAVLESLRADHIAGGTRLRAMALQAQSLWSRKYRRRDALEAWEKLISHCGSMPAQ